MLDDHAHRLTLNPVTPPKAHGSGPMLDDHVNAMLVHPVPAGAVRVLTMDSVVLGLASFGCDCCTVRVFRPRMYTLSRMPLCFDQGCTHSRGCRCVSHVFIRLKLLHACDQWHPLGRALPLLAGTVNSVHILKV
jgi:hypothetical protein